MYYRYYLHMTYVLALAVAAGIGGSYSQAAYPRGNGLAEPTGTELIVFETQECLYCQLFRRDVLPRVLRSSKTRSILVTFVDLNRGNRRNTQLQRPLVVVPTFVLIRRGREVGRITGYTGLQNFFLLMDEMLRQPE